MKDTKTEILEFWFAETQPKQWFQKSDDFDDLITSRFEGDYTLATNGVYDMWQDSADGCLALCLLLDQFSRNMFRGTKKSFASDAKALTIAKHAVSKNYQTLLSPTQQVFLFLPFEHSENITDQKTSVALFETIKEEEPITHDYAIKHLNVIEQFGRFPHRNPILGRDSTEEELSYIKQGGGF